MPQSYQVSVPYEITLLSNQNESRNEIEKVSVPYEITLLSNVFLILLLTFKVSVPYEITLLSNSGQNAGFLLSFQYLMKLHYSQTSNKLRHYNAQGNNIRYIYYTIYVSPSSITQRSLSTTYSFSPSQSLCGSEFSSIKKLICSRAKAFNSSDISSGEK